MQGKTVYQADSQGFYVGEAVADPCGLEPGKYLIPGLCYEDAPPQPGANQWPRRVGDAWVLVPDYVGLVWWDVERNVYKIVERGLAPPEGALLADPGPTPAQRLAELQRQAKLALIASDKVAARCVKFGVPYPEAWRNRDAALVVIANLPEDADPDAVSWPDDVPYPAGTEWAAVA